MGGENVLLQLGVGGIFALFMVREVLNFLKTRNGHSRNGASGEKSVEYWQEQIRRASAEGFEPMGAKILDRLDQSNSELRALRASTHELNGNINLLLGKLTGIRN